MASTARHDMIASAITLFRERGIDATAFSDVLEHSGAPRGSIYHHFPGGKAQLVREATETAGDQIARGIAAVAAHMSDPVDVLDALIAGWRLQLESSGFTAGCPVAAAVASPGVEGGAAAAGAAFTRWEQVLAEALGGYGFDSSRAASLATLVVSSIEGGVLLARATRSIAPLERIAAELRLVLADATPA